MLLYFIRHGETTWNAMRKIQGTADIPLNENGLHLAEITGKALMEVPFDFAVSSPLQRARKTAELALGGRSIPIYADDRLQEINFGQLEGCSVNTIGEDHPLRTFFTDPYKFEPAPGGETIQQVCERTADFYQELIGKEENENKTILIATHGCTLRGLLRNVYEDTSDYWHGDVCPNCGVNIVEVKSGVAKFLAQDQVYY